MTSPARALRGALIAAWKADATVAGLLGSRLYDRVPESVAYPYVAFGQTQVLPDPADDIPNARELYQTIHVWSRAVGSLEAIDIAEALVVAAPKGPLALDGWSLVGLDPGATDIMTDTDGLTTHAVVTLHAFLDPTS